MKKLKLVIDAGHGGKDPGAVFRDLKEKDVNLQVATKMLVMLCGLFDVKMTRVVDRYVGLTERTNIANDFGADLFLSIHCNADPDSDQPGMPEAKGEEIWHFTGSVKGKQYADVMRDYVDMMFPNEPFRGVKNTKGFTVLAKTNCPAVLVEMGFIDNSETARQFKDPAVITELALTLALGLLKILRDFSRK